MSAGPGIPRTAVALRRRRRREGAFSRAAAWAGYLAGRGYEVATRPLTVWQAAALLAAVGRFVAPLVPAVRARVGGNLDRIHPDWDRRARRRLMAESTGHFCRLMVEYVHLRRFIRDVRLEVRGMEHIETAAAEGRGVLIVTGHYGNWEAIRVACLRAGLPAGIIYRPFNNRPVDARTMRLIVDAGTPVMQKGPRGLRLMTRHLTGGGRALLLADQRTSHAPVIDFLGHPAETLTVAPALAARTGAVLLTARGRRLDGRGRFDVLIEPPVPEDTPEAMMAEVNRRIGAWIEEVPEQWFWLHRRWRLSRRHARRAGIGPRRRAEGAAVRERDDRTGDDPTGNAAPPPEGAQPPRSPGAS